MKFSGVPVHRPVLRAARGRQDAVCLAIRRMGHRGALPAGIPAPGRRARAAAGDGEPHDRLYAQGV